MWSKAVRSGRVTENESLATEGAGESGKAGRYLEVVFGGIGSGTMVDDDAVVGGELVGDGVDFCGGGVAG